MRYLLLLFIFLNCLAPLHSTTYYVSSEMGDDSNTGISEKLPFKTIQKAADLTVPGDVVYIMNGTYKNTDNEPGFMQTQVVFVKNSGTANAWITFQALEGHHPKIKTYAVNGFRLTASKDLTTGKTLCYIRLKNLIIEGNANEYSLCDALNQPKSCNNPNGELNYLYNGSGIAIGSDNEYAQPGKTAHHFEIINCEIYNCTSSGISAYNSDYVTIKNCKIYNNCSKTVHGSSGIHIYNPRNCELTEPTEKNFKILTNEIYNNRIEVPFFNGNECFGYTDGNGIIIDDSHNDQTIKIPFYGSFLIEGNVIYENGGSGISIFRSDNITICNNTTYKNCQLTPDSNKRSELLILKSNDIRIHNNIFYARERQQSYYKGSKCKKIESYTNVIYNGRKNSRLKKSIKADPLFVSVSDSPKIKVNCNDFVLEVITESLPKDLRLQPQSSARGKTNITDLPSIDFTGKKVDKSTKGCIGAFQ